MQPDINAVGLPFGDAIDFFRNKVRVPTRTWTDIFEGAHARAFVIAGATKDQLLKDFQGAILKAIAEGTTLEEFRKDFDNIVARHGWSYNGGRGWRTRVIYHTNLRQAHMAGQWRQFQRLKEQRPYLRYIALQGGDRRPEHQKLHGLVLPVDHPLWKIIMPMNGWGCKCTVQSLSERDMKRFGYEVTKTPPKLEFETRKINTVSGPINIKTPKGIDPGFGFNIGEAAWGNQVSRQTMEAFKNSSEKAWETITPGDWASLSRPDKIPADRTRHKLGPKASTKRALTAAIEKSLDGKERVFDLPDGTPVLVNAETLSDHISFNRAPYVPFIPELIADPYEIWMAFEKHRATGKVVLRKRFLKIINTGRDTNLIFVANAVNGIFEGWTFIPVRNQTRLNKERYGHLVYAREDDKS